MKRLIKIADNVFIVWLVFYLIYNTYFGWNSEPINKAEYVCDQISNVMVNGAVLMFMIATFRVTRDYIDKNY